MPRGPDHQLQSRRARRGGLEAGMRFLEPPRRKGGSAAAAPLSLPLLAGAGQTPLPASVSRWGRGWRHPWQRVRSRWRPTAESVSAPAGCSPGRAAWVWGEFVELRARAAQLGLQLDRDGFLPAVAAPAAAALVQSLFNVSGILWYPIRKRTWPTFPSCALIKALALLQQLLSSERWRCTPRHPHQ